MADQSNEITAVPELLQLLEIAGCIVTVDAIGTQTEIAETIVEGGGDYLLAVKENQGHLFEDVQYLFEVDVVQEFKHAQHSYVKTVNKGHGRIEIRECWATEKEEYISLWYASASNGKDSRALFELFRNDKLVKTWKCRPVISSPVYPQIRKRF